MHGHFLEEGMGRSLLVDPEAAEGLERRRRPQTLSDRFKCEPSSFLVMSNLTRWRQTEDSHWTITNLHTLIRVLPFPITFGSEFD